MFSRVREDTSHTILISIRPQQSDFGFTFIVVLSVLPLMVIVAADLQPRDLISNEIQGQVS